LNPLFKRLTKQKWLRCFRKIFVISQTFRVRTKTVITVPKKMII